MTNEEALLEICYVSQYGYRADKSIIGTDRVNEAFLMARKALETVIALEQAYESCRDCKDYDFKQFLPNVRKP